MQATIMPMFCSRLVNYLRLSVIEGNRPREEEGVVSLCTDATGTRSTEESC